MAFIDSGVKSFNVCDLERAMSDKKNKGYDNLNSFTCSKYERLSLLRDKWNRGSDMVSAVRTESGSSSVGFSRFFFDQIMVASFGLSTVQLSTTESPILFTCSPDIATMDGFGSHNTGWEII